MLTIYKDGIVRRLNLLEYQMSFFSNLANMRNSVDHYKVPISPLIH